MSPETREAIAELLVRIQNIEQSLDSVQNVLQEHRRDLDIFDARTRG